MNTKPSIQGLLSLDASAGSAPSITTSSNHALSTQPRGRGALAALPLALSLLLGTAMVVGVPSFGYAANCPSCNPDDPDSGGWGASSVGMTKAPEPFFSKEGRSIQDDFAEFWDGDESDFQSFMDTWDQLQKEIWQDHVDQIQDIINDAIADGTIPDDGQTHSVELGDGTIVVVDKNGNVVGVVVGVDDDGKLVLVDGNGKVHIMDGEGSGIHSDGHGGLTMNDTDGYTGLDGWQGGDQADGSGQPPESPGGYHIEQGHSDQGTVALVYDKDGNVVGICIGIDANGDPILVPLGGGPAFTLDGEGNLGMAKNENGDWVPPDNGHTLPDGGIVGGHSGPYAAGDHIGEDIVVVGHPDQDHEGQNGPGDTWNPRNSIVPLIPPDLEGDGPDFGDDDAEAAKPLDIGPIDGDLVTKKAIEIFNKTMNRVAVNLYVGNPWSNGQYSGKGGGNIAHDAIAEVGSAVLMEVSGAAEGMEHAQEHANDRENWTHADSVLGEKMGPFVQIGHTGINNIPDFGQSDPDGDVASNHGNGGGRGDHSDPKHPPKPKSSGKHGGGKHGGKGSSPKPVLLPVAAPRATPKLVTSLPHSSSDHSSRDSGSGRSSSGGGDSGRR